ncbi:putative prefoldin subunit 6 [Golovinomyces cichoracearum]|uniref:Putative prefoldin subunit 6 n=1 Tax=Golovinomyces cichoracearum TaxID=62708 RepID=A0A420J5I8_9PEZI|nr:putative prefoldin subunit 6 [Golovinomyces cichoracearum]
MAQPREADTLPDEFQSLQRGNFYEQAKNFYLILTLIRRSSKSHSIETELQQKLSNNLVQYKKLMCNHQEFSNLDNNTNIYKLCGPVLLKQDRTEAVLAVDARIEFINNEIKRVEKQIEDVQSKCNAIREKMC